ncbi:MAG: TIGR01212 family radical SAM protein [Alistipes sp.]|nr:TIGR01212 family radical SAM protein [Alistipes sp.]
MKSTSTLPYSDYGSAMQRRFGGRVQKLAIDAGLGCPNRDGNLSFGGCSFCRNDAFSPSYCRENNDIEEQINNALKFHASHRRHAGHYLAYFQSGSNTYASTSRLEELYTKALNHPAIDGIVIGTRADCISSEKLDLLHYLSHRAYVAVEYGIESVYDTTLQRVNRGHDFRTVECAVVATRERGIDVGGHLIVGLMDESREDLIRGMERINTLKLNFIKFHQLQIYRSTPIAEEWQKSPERFLFGSPNSVDSYIELMIELLRHLIPSTAVERLVSSAPHHLLLHSPLGGLRPDAVRERIIAKMIERKVRQGDALLG